MHGRHLIVPSLACLLLLAAPPARAGFNRTTASPIALGAGAAPQTVAVGDVNGDGNPDIVVAEFGLNKIGVLLGNGAGGFGALRQFAAGPAPVGVALADFDQDRHLDVAVTNDLRPGRVTVLFGDGAGNFGGAVTEGVGDNPRGAVAGDFNADGHADLAVANSGDGSVSIVLGNGAGAFTNAAGSPVLTEGALPQLLVVGDWNGDGRADLATANSGDNSVSVLLGNGRGGFALAPGSPFFAGPAPVGIAAGDLDGDGRADLVVTNDTDPGEVTLFFGKGGGAFPQWDTFPVGSNPTFVAVKQVSSNGALEIITANGGSDDVSVLVGRGNGTFLPAVQVPAGAGPLALAIGDFDLDAAPDIAVSDNLGDAVTVLLQGPQQAPDTVPPVSTATFNPDANANGWWRRNVHVTLRAVDNAGGSGVKNITFSATGAQPIGSRTVNGDQVSFDITQEGSTTITFFATDNAGNEGTPHSVTVRLDKTAPQVTASATPNTLWPPNGKMVTITVTGRVVDALSGVDRSSGEFTVDDEYRLVKPEGTFTINADGTYRFTVQLEARRKGNDKNGRKYVIQVTAADLAGNTDTATAQVIVPHDQGKHGGNGNGNSGGKKAKKGKKGKH